MINGALKKRIKQVGFMGDIHQHIPMSELTSFRIGGPADLILFPSCVKDLQMVMSLFGQEGVKALPLGNGTNILVSDRGVREPLISLSHGFREIKSEGTKVTAGGGVGLAQLLRFGADSALNGLEPLAGIPGTVGGAIKMNAGIRGTEIGNVVSSLMIIDSSGQIRRLKRDEVHFGYRSIDLPKETIILQGEFSLQKGKAEDIKERMEAILRTRSKTQPLSLPSAGSIFRNPRGIPAGQLIEELGLKGYRIGDAMVSTIHANFIVNLGAACAKDVIGLIDVIRERVYQEIGITLELEVEIIGEHDWA
jgi:UDP-N-acetylmuramate dehydrogenase